MSLWGVTSSILALPGGSMRSAVVPSCIFNVFILYHSQWTDRVGTNTQCPVQNIRPHHRTLYVRRSQVQNWKLRPKIYANKVEQTNFVLIHETGVLVQHTAMFCHIFPWPFSTQVPGKLGKLSEMIRSEAHTYESAASPTATAWHELAAMRPMSPIRISIFVYEAVAWLLRKWCCPRQPVQVPWYSKKIQMHAFKLRPRAPLAQQDLQAADLG